MHVYSLPLKKDRQNLILKRWGLGKSMIIKGKLKISLSIQYQKFTKNTSYIVNKVLKKYPHLDKQDEDYNTKSLIHVYINLCLLKCKYKCMNKT